MPDDQAAFPRIAKYRHSRSKELLAKAAMPVLSVLHRRLFRRAAELAYDVALRLNGFAITFRGREHLTMAEERFLARMLPGLGDGAVLDVGANNGHYAEFLRRRLPSHRILAFEPHPRTYAALVARLSGQPIETHNLALSDQVGTLPLHDFADEDGSTQASLSAASVGLFDGGVVSHDVEVTTLDRFAAAHAIGRVAFLKLDTEGHDINVLHGAREMLAGDRIDVIQFEFIPANVGARVFMRDFFQALPGYDLHRLMLDGSLLPMPTYDVKRHEVFVIHNLVAIRKGWQPAQGA